MVAYYHASMMPPPDAGKTPFPVNRKEAMAAKDVMETVDGAKARIAAGGPTPAHYVPTPSAGTGGGEVNESPFAATGGKTKSAAE